MKRSDFFKGLAGLATSVIIPFPFQKKPVYIDLDVLENSPHIVRITRVLPLPCTDNEPEWPAKIVNVNKPEILNEWNLVRNKKGIVGCVTMRFSNGTFVIRPVSSEHKFEAKAGDYLAIYQNAVGEKQTIKFT